MNPTLTRIRKGISMACLPMCFGLVLSMVACKEKPPISGRFEWSELRTDPANVFRERSSGRLVNGSIVRTNFEGVVEFEVGVTNGRFHGTMISRFPDGQPEQELEYQDGVEHGWHRTWYANGQLRSEAKRVEGKLQGDLRAWDEDGELVQHGVYNDGVLIKVLEGEFSAVLTNR